MPQETRKKRVLFHSNHSKLFTGFAKHEKQILRRLFDTDKYEIIEFANGFAWDDERLKNMPWTCQGSLPNDQAKLQSLNGNEYAARKAAYGHEMIDEAIRTYKPDVYIGMEDVWAFTDFWRKPWWNKISSAIWTTLDSLPILDEAYLTARNTKHFWSWASFAEKAMKAKDPNKYGHVKTFHGSIDASCFRRLPDEDRAKLRAHYNIKQDDYIIGFVFRNQLRKSVPNLIDGFKLLKSKHPNAKLLLHTHWSEQPGNSWDIQRLINESGISNSDVLTTYVCASCGRYEIKPFEGQERDCKYCSGKKTQNTTNIKVGVKEWQLNEIYNLMDLYCHPFTSGGQEMPIQEAKLTELATLVTNYSCGEDYCHEHQGGLPLAWHPYLEPNSQFIKATTCAKSIAAQIDFCINNPERTRDLGRIGRQYVLANCSVDAIASRLEEWLDNQPFADYDFNFKGREADLSYKPEYWNANQFAAKSEADLRELSDKFITDIYHNMLNCAAVDCEEKDLWFSRFKQGAAPSKIYEHFVKMGQDINSKSFTKDVFSLVPKDGRKKALFVVSSSDTAAYLTTGRIADFAAKEPETDIYAACPKELAPFLVNNLHIKGLLPYFPEMENDLVTCFGKNAFDKSFVVDGPLKTVSNFLT